jgi:hypothetical protein
MRIAHATLFDGYAATGTAVTFNSAALSLKHIIAWSGTATFTDIPDGYISMQASNDEESPSTWVTITQPTTTLQNVTANGSVLYNYSNAGYRWIRAVWLNTSGSCTVTVKLNLKGV